MNTFSLTACFFLFLGFAFIQCDPPVEGQELKVDWSLQYSTIRNITWKDVVTDKYNFTVDNKTMTINFEFMTSFNSEKNLMVVVYSDPFSVSGWYSFTAVGNITVKNQVDPAKTIVRPYRTGLNKFKPGSWPQKVASQEEILTGGWYDEKNDKIDFTITLKKEEKKQNLS